MMCTDQSSIFSSKLNPTRYSRRLPHESEGLGVGDGKIAARSTYHLAYTAVVRRFGERRRIRSKALPEAKWAARRANEVLLQDKREPLGREDRVPNLLEDGKSLE